ncbi:hypothetical protein ACO1O0_004032 [Amphichorda felina]
MAQGATHLLEGVTTRGDVLKDAPFLDLGQFFFPLASELDTRRDNSLWEVWNGSDSPAWGILHHLKCFSAIAGPDGKRMEGKDPNCTLEGLRLVRAKRSLGPKANVFVGERRISIAVLAAASSSASTCTREPDARRYNALCVVSPGGRFKPPDPLETSRMLDIQQTSGHWAPVVCFLTIFACATRMWFEYWDTFLDTVDMFEDDNILLQDQLQNGSVSGGARDEETCLEVSRLLRRAERWIRETQRNFERTRCEIMDDEPRRFSGAEVMRSNWLNVGRMLQERSDRLIHRIDRLIKEFEDLRQLE